MSMWLLAVCAIVDADVAFDAAAAKTGVFC